MAADPNFLTRKQSLAPLQSNPRAPVAAFGRGTPDGSCDDISNGGERGGSPAAHEPSVTFSAENGSGLTGSAPADAVAATLAGYDGVLVLNCCRSR